MTIESVSIKNYGEYVKLEATVLSANCKYYAYIVYYNDTARWYSDSFTISDSIKKMCRCEWYKAAKKAGLNRKALNVII